MMADYDEFLSEAAAEMYVLNADEIVRQQCRAREEYYAHERWVKKQMQELHQQLAEKDREIAELKAMLSNQK